jgi:protein SCO1/2
MSRRLPVLVLLLCTLLVSTACTSSSGAGEPKSSELVNEQQTGKYQGEALHPAQPRPSFTLTDTQGKKFAFGSTTSGHPTLLYFGYTHCPDVCPETMADVSLALAHVPAAVARKTYVVFVTTDVKRDTGPVIAKWLSNFSRGSKGTWVGLRGTQAQIDAAQAAAHVLVAQDGGQTHSAEMLLYGPDDYAKVAYLATNDENKQLTHDLPLVARAV